jgi:hypothetical protein
MASHQERCSRVAPRSGLVPAAPNCRAMESAQALRPATALPAALGGRNSTGYYGLSAPLLTLVISRPTIAGVNRGSGVARVASVVLP